MSSSLLLAGWVESVVGGLDASDGRMGGTVCFRGTSSDLSLWHVSVRQHRLYIRSKICSLGEFRELDLALLHRLGPRKDVYIRTMKCSLGVS